MPPRPRPAGPVARVAGLLRLVHPFPSLLDGAVTTTIALVAGGSLPAAAGLGAGMTALQFGIGAVNDLVDAPADALVKPAKPIPAGLVEPGTARLVAGAAFGVGLLLSAAAGPLVLSVAVAAVAIGLAYDLVLKGTAWSWLPFAIGIPLLPVYGWLGAAGTLPGPFAILIPAAVLSGAALALANGLADLERDRATGTASAPAFLGRTRTVRLVAGLHALVGLAAASSLVGYGALGIAALGVAAAFGLVAVGVRLGTHADPARRERGWELQAIGTGLAAVAWILSLAGTGAF